MFVLVVLSFNFNIVLSTSYVCYVALRSFVSLTTDRILVLTIYTITLLLFRNLYVSFFDVLLITLLVDT